ncbi:MAG TPA: YbaK/EbsC family protein [Candidatus Binatia bacterium]|jgi:Ala-tRNA(Pro) deacylase
MLGKLKVLLDDAKISYEVYNHRTAVDAHKIATTLHISEREIATVAILKVDGSLVMAVVPGSRLVSLASVRNGLAAKEVGAVSEEEIAARLSDSEIEAIPPFGNLFGLPVYLDPALERDETIVFNAGSCRETIRMGYKDFKKLVRPRIVPLIYEGKRPTA